MKVENNKIIECTEDELYEQYVKAGYDELFSFTDYRKQCEALGTKVIIEGIEEKTDTIKYKDREYIEKQHLHRIDEKGIKYWTCEEVAELIRCKDCKHFNATKDIMGMCKHFVRLMFMRDYCSRGERRDDDDDDTNTD